jgi:hypothetical protein
MAPTSLPPAPLLSAYWLNSELTNTYPAPTPRNVLCYTRHDGSPQIGVVYLVGASFAGSPGSFQAPYLSFAPSLRNVLENGDVGLLRNAGVRVLLCIQGSSGMGWGSLSDAQSQAFAAWLQTDVIQKYGLDGFDIDDEFSDDVPRSSQQLVNTVAWLRSTLPGSLITKALWNDTPGRGSADFTTAASSSPLAGKTLAGLLSFGSTMDYGDSAQGMESFASAYVELGMTYDRLCIGVQPGPQDQGWMTSLDTTSSVASWVKQNGALGMMMWSFSQDIAEFTTSPQYSVPYPSADDHLWQKTIIENWGGAADWVVNTAGIRTIYFPEGSFSWTSTGIQVLLTVDLQNRAGGWVAGVTVDITGFDNADLVNSNGAFVKSEVMLSPDDMQSIRGKVTAAGLGDFVPVGSYFLTARNVGVKLVAQCRNNAGVAVNSSLDLTRAIYAQTIVENIDGVLTVRPV